MKYDSKLPSQQLALFGVILLALLFTTLATAETQIPTSDAQPQTIAKENSEGYVLPFASSDSQPYSGYLTTSQRGTPADIAFNYIRSEHGAYNLKSSDVSGLIITNQYVSKHNGVNHIYIRQEINGIEVFGSTSDIHITADGRILKFGNRFFTNIASVRAADADPAISAADAVVSAAAELGFDTQVEQFKTLSRSTTANRATTLSGGTLTRGDIPAKLMYHPLQDGTFQLVWDLVLDMQANDDMWNLRVDTNTGEIISRDNWTIYEAPHIPYGHHGLAAPRPETAFTDQDLLQTIPDEPVVADDLVGQVIYEVYPIPLRDPDEGPRQLVFDPSDPLASPYGWHDYNGAPGAEFTTAWGNNVLAFSDPNNNDDPFTNFTPEGGPDLLFSYPINLNQNPATYEAASVTNLFYWNNVTHDMFYHYGFDEASGNFQFDNYDRGGLGADPVYAQAQDGGGFNNANFSSPPDGQPGRMQMYLGGPDANGVIRDGSLDNHVIVHEYAHGISIRLVGGPATGCLGGIEQGGEGWSDWIGLVMIADEGDTGAMPIPVGNWLVGEGPNGFGIRPYPFSTDMNVNPSTFGDVADAATFSVPHGVGSIWGSMMWDMYWALIERDGFDPNIYTGTGGNNVAIQLVIDGLKFTSCFPTFNDQRDGILAADLATYPLDNPQPGFPQSQNECLIWESFAKRGLGYSADSGSANDRFDQTEAFDLPPQCLATPSFTLETSPASVEICAADGSANFTADVSSFLGYSNAVTFSAQNLPGASTADFSPNGTAAPYTSTLTIGNTAALTTGNYDIQVSAADGATTITDTVTLQVFDSTPSAPTLTAPADTATDISPLEYLTLEWSDVAASSFTVEIATDSGFATVIYSATVQTNSTTIPQDTLSASTTYHWRVTGGNLCGDGIASATSSFTTADYADILMVDNDQTPSAPTTDYFTDALDTLNVSYDVWDNDGVTLTTTILDNYDAVIWNSSDLNGVNAEDALATYLDNTGCLLVSAQDYHYLQGITPFMDNYLGVESADDDVSHTEVQGAGVFAAFGPTTLDFPSNYSGNWSDILEPDVTAQTAFIGDANGGTSTAVTKETANYKTAFFGFPVEALPTTGDRANALFTFLEWCGTGNSPGVSAIEFTQTVGLDPATCGTGDTLFVPAGTDITYCYEVTNSGTVTQTLHDLSDNQLGDLLVDFAFDLAPEASVFVTQTVNITADTLSTSTWSATNEDGFTVSATDGASVYVTSSVASFDSCLDFETGTLPNSMKAVVDEFGTYNGRVAVDTQFPYRGDYALNLDTDVSGVGFTTQAAVWAVDLSGQTDVELNLWVREHGDENHLQDGIFFSDDNGQTFVLAQSLNGFSSSYTNVQLDVADFAANNGLTLTDNFLIKFQSYDNFSIPTDGYSFDDICIQPKTATLSNSTKTAPAIVTNNDTITYTIVLENSGLADITALAFSDPIPAQTTYVANSVTASAGTLTYNAGSQTVEWTGNIPTASTVNITFEAIVSGTVGTVITNTATTSHPFVTPVTLEAFTSIVPTAPILTYNLSQASARLSTNETTTRTLTLGNLGNDTLNWSVFETDCNTPVDISWLSVTPPTTGSTAINDTEDLTLGFDTAGLATGIYQGDLCIASNDLNSPETIIPFILVVSEGTTIDLTVTAGNDPNTCATTDTFNMLVGDTDAVICYQIENTSLVSFDNHELIALAGSLIPTDTIVFTDTMTSLGAGETLVFTTTETITADGSIDFEWTSSSFSNYTTTDTATVNFTVNNVMSVTYTTTVGTDINSCAATDTLHLPDGPGEVAVCHHVENTGDITFTSYELSELTDGVIITTSETVFAPGEILEFIQPVTLTADRVLDYTWASSDDVDNALTAMDSVTVTVALVPAVEFTATVGTDPASCATTSSVNLPQASGDVTFCYQVENTGTLSLTTHTLTEATAGTIFTDTTVILQPGDTVIITNTQAITQDTTFDYTWTSSIVNAIATDSATVTVTVTSSPVTYTAYLPFVTTPSSPDLVVESVTVTADNLTVVIRNAGTAAVNGTFYVDAYIGLNDPAQPPTAVNNIWQDFSPQGIAWGIDTPDALLAPGETLTLSWNDTYQLANLTLVSFPITAGTPIYVQVDSAAVGSTYGGVLETHEIEGGPYNNIFSLTAP